MDSSNFQHHQQHLQDHEHHFVPSSPLNTPSIYQPLSSSLPWNHSFFSTNNTGSISNPFNTKLCQDNDIHTVTGDSRSSDNNLSSKTISTITDNDTKNLTFTSTTNFQKIEEDMLSSFPSFSSLIQSTIIPGGPPETLNWFNGGSSSSEGPPGLIQLPSLDQKDHHHQSPLINWSGGFTNPSLLNQLGLVSSPNSTTSVTSSPRLGLNLQAMNFFGNNNANFNCGNNNNSNNHRSFYDNNVGEEVVSQAYGGRVISNKTMMNGGTSAKRATSGDNQPKASTSNNTTSTKKSQLKVSCPPFKVRKEKLGERIAALHQLVSPFGKTDTASVLTEAIGYIQFLQDQIHTLCMPHAKSSRSKACRPFQMGGGIEEERKEEERIDLGRRGLCLVPLSWTSYLTPTQLDASNPSYF